MGKLLVFVMLVLLFAEAGALYLGYERQKVMQGQLVSQQNQIIQLQQQLAVQNELIASLEEDSVGAMVKKANAVIVEGWDAIATSVESELEKARHALKDLNEDTEAKQ
ncbi:hypothetical protein QWI17_07975 [Gilvimarinus sp. SDUM040013]|uniref:Uncharacterized protein n=1 Tax=Gilvimarinus gilvus TaxID=3058038 RepID=A0ABU4S2H1_9GAMM|nr:hypothetical protein [Gilvimarinus sp. SDUM040013]MDO3385771.1 hypothetical protein [Gilvimarinus sp. SDUM040013]MDX6850667.1 hypothetical protein [Gilvimarinus sp. SDUM040013]